MAEHGAAKEKNEAILKRDRREDLQPPIRIKGHKRAFPKMLEEFDSVRDGYLRHINIAEHRVELLNDDLRPVLCLISSGADARKLAASEISLIITEKALERATTKGVARIVLALMKNYSLCICVYYQKLNGVTVSDSYPLPRKDVCIDSLREVKVFSTMDTDFGYV